MSNRSGYTEDYDNDWSMICWRGAVASAISGKRGQAFLKEMLQALDDMPEKKLIENDLIREGEVCAIGSVGVKRGLDMTSLDPEYPQAIAEAFGVARALVQEIEFENDEGRWEAMRWDEKETPEHRWTRMRRWVESNIRVEKETSSNENPTT